MFTALLSWQSRYTNATSSYYTCKCKLTTKWSPNKPTNLGLSSPVNTTPIRIHNHLLLPTSKPLLILASHGGWKAKWVDLSTVYLGVQPILNIAVTVVINTTGQWPQWDFSNYSEACYHITIWPMRLCTWQSMKKCHLRYFEVLNYSTITRLPSHLGTGRVKLPIGYNGVSHIHSQNYPLLWTDPQTKLHASSLGPSDPLSQTTSISSQPFCHNALERQDTDQQMVGENAEWL